MYTDYPWGVQENWGFTLFEKVYKGQLVTVTTPLSVSNGNMLATS